MTMPEHQTKVPYIRKLVYEMRNVPLDMLYVPDYGVRWPNMLCSLHELMRSDVDKLCQRVVRRSGVVSGHRRTCPMKRRLLPQKGLRGLRPLMMHLHCLPAFLLKPLSPTRPSFPTTSRSLANCRSSRRARLLPCAAGSDLGHGT